LGIALLDFECPTVQQILTIFIEYFHLAEAVARILTVRSNYVATAMNLGMLSAFH
jgi:hypothetical protein